MEDACDLVGADLFEDLGRSGGGKVPDIGGSVVLPSPDDLSGSVVLIDEEVE